VIGGLPITKELPPIGPRPLGLIDGVMGVIGKPTITEEAYLSQ
jgi:hypothetical protein